MLGEKNKHVCLILLGLSLLFTLFIPTLVVWGFPQFLGRGLGGGIRDFSPVADPIVRAAALFIIDIFIKITLLILIFKKEN